MADQDHPAVEPISNERLAELQQQIADVISDNVKLMVLATNCTQDQFEKSWQGVRDALAQQATSIVAARIRQDAETIREARKLNQQTEYLLRNRAQQAERERDQLKRQCSGLAQQVETTLSTIRARDVELDQLRKTVQGIRDAWLIAGRSPVHHRAAQRQLVENWPTLYRAIRSAIGGNDHG